MQYLWSILLCSCLLFPEESAAQVPDSSLLTVDRLFGSREFSSQPFGPARWIDDGEAYTTVEPSVTSRGGKDIVRYDCATGKRSILIPADRLKPEGDSTALLPESYEWSPDKNLLLLYTRSRKVWRVNSRGDYWIKNLNDETLWKLGGNAMPSSLMFAKFSPDGKNVAYVHDNNISVQNLQTREITPLTTDGSRTLINGTFDWVYEEEFSLRDGFRWSPDGQRIAYWQLDASGVREFFLINNTDSLYPFVVPVQYPKVGETLSACRIGTVSVTGGSTTWIDLPDNPRNAYIPKMEWAASSGEVAFQYMNRRQNVNRLMIADPRTGIARPILEDHDSTWVEVVESVEWVNEGSAFTWLSESEGWNHCYLHSREGKRLRDCTPGEYDVMSIERIEPRGGWLYFAASPQNPARRLLYRARLDGKGKPERVTPAAQEGTHTYNIAPNARWALHTRSSMAAPPVLELISLPDHRIVRTLTENLPLRKSLDRLKQGNQRFFRIDIGRNLLLDGWEMLPPDFDSTKHYPVIVHVYGEPAAQTVLDRWGGSGYLWHLLLTQMGYIVVSVDNRGTPAPRGRAWRKSIYRQIGILASADQAAAVGQIRRWPYVDSTRIGVWGWSGGGSMTLNALFRYPELYQTGIAVASVSDERLYDAIYQERYMGLLADNKEGYIQGSPITHVSGLKGNLLLVHGTGDDNVHYQSAERLINALVKANKQFTIMPYPNRSHGIFEGENTTRHLYTLLTEYFAKYLPPGPR
jgi:dipeptidyl-peptidase 4